MYIKNKISRKDFLKNVEHWCSLIAQQYSDEEDEELTFEIMKECVRFLNEQGFETTIFVNGNFNSLNINYKKEVE